MATTLNIGDKAPTFKIKDQNEELVSLAALKSNWVILYFYPKDLTPGCTIEACDFTEHFPKFQEIKAVIYGVSPDSPALHRKFIEKKKLKLSLLSDEDKALCKQYGVWQLKKFMGKEYMGVVRSTFLINPQGEIAYIWEQVKVAGHVTEVLKKLKELT